MRSVWSDCDAVLYKQTRPKLQNLLVEVGGTVCLRGTRGPCLLVGSRYHAPKDKPGLGFLEGRAQRSPGRRLTEPFGLESDFKYRRQEECIHEHCCTYSGHASERRVGPDSIHGGGNSPAPGGRAQALAKGSGNRAARNSPFPQAHRAGLHETATRSHDRPFWRPHMEARTHGACGPGTPWVSLRIGPRSE